MYRIWFFERFSNEVDEELRECRATHWVDSVY